jgi:hypothetical protein
MTNENCSLRFLSSSVAADWGFSKDPDNKGEHSTSLVKSNLSRSAAGRSTVSWTRGRPARREGHERSEDRVNRRDREDADKGLAQRHYRVTGIYKEGSNVCLVSSPVKYAVPAALSVPPGFASSPNSFPRH